MEICWDNIENLYLVKSSKHLRNRKTGTKYIERGPCKNCGEYFLAQPQSKSLFCSKYCAKISENNGRWIGGYRKNNLPRYDQYKERLEKYENIRRAPHDSNLLEVACCECGTFYTPPDNQVRDRLMWIETGKRKESKFYCSDKCKRDGISFHKKKYPSLISHEREKERMRNYRENNKVYLSEYEKRWSRSYCLWNSKLRKKLEKFEDVINVDGFIKIKCEWCEQLFFPTNSQIMCKLQSYKKKNIRFYLWCGCDHPNQTSSHENEIYEFIKENFEDLEIRKNNKNTIMNPNTNKNLELDIYFPELQKAIEVNGIYWHSFPEKEKRDEIKKKQCKELNIGLMVVSDKDWDWDKSNIKIRISKFLERE